MDSLEKLEKEKKHLENILSGMTQKSENERKLEIMNLLHKYNNVKDATQTLIGGLANIDHVTSKEIHDRLNLPNED